MTEDQWRQAKELAGRLNEASYRGARDWCPTGWPDGRPGVQSDIATADMNLVEAAEAVAAIEPATPAATPGHYAWSGVPPIDVIEAWGMGPPFCLGNAIKYIGRWKHKGGLKDLAKARDYIGRAIAMLEKEAAK